MNTFKTAIKILNIYQDYDPYDFPYEDITAETIEEDIVNDTQLLIDDLNEIAAAYSDTDLGKYADIISVVDQLNDYQKRQG